jgi:SAM-dependent methyltransferase
MKITRDTTAPIAPTVYHALDTPPNDSINDPLGFKVSGWVWDPRRSSPPTRVEGRVDGRVIGSTQHIFQRPDVAQAVSPTALYSGFAFFARADWLLGTTASVFELVAIFGDGAEVSFARKGFYWINHDYTKEPYGGLLLENALGIAHRENIYTSGSSVAVASPECVGLIQQFLGPPPLSVLDVGCGVGAYAHPLRGLGYDWMGTEIKDSDCAALAAQNLPHRKSDGNRLPFDDASFDAAIAIEVLEHIQDAPAFLMEMRRVAKKRILLSVPNAELIPYMHPHLAVPWHLLEGDHKNFFTRASLAHLLRGMFRHVEILPYGVQPIRSAEGLPLYFHLFAIVEI